MLEILKSKSVIIFIVIVLGATYMSTFSETKLEENNIKTEQVYINTNLK